jgi:hypothetical protein
MTKNKEYNWCRNKLIPNTKKRSLVVFGVILIAIALILSFSLALADSARSTDLSAQASGADIVAAPPAPTVNAATSVTQFNLSAAYAYVGSAPSRVTSYLDSKSNSLMYLIDQYPSVVRLNITCLPGIQIPSCDAVIEVYGVKIATDTGLTEYYAFFVGTNYNSYFSQSDLKNLVPCVNDIVDRDVYSGITGSFQFNWTANTSILSHTIGSIMSYSINPSNYTGLWSAGKPNAISVSVYRIGYITMSNGSVSLFKDSTTNVIDSVQLSNYEDGFLYNKLMPSSELPQTNLFQPIP